MYDALALALIERGLVDAAGIERARRLQQASGEALPRVLARLALVSDRAMADTLAGLSGLRLMEARDFPDLAPTLDLVSSLAFLKENHILPFAADEHGIDVAVADPFDGYALRALDLLFDRPLRLHVASPGDIETALDRLTSRAGAGREQSGSAEADHGTDDVQRLRDLASEAPVIRLVNGIIARAVEAGASDIHVEPLERRLRIRQRLDGVLREVESPPQRLQAAILSRIKIMARLDIAERRVPQDGRIRLAVQGREVDLRVSTVPGIHGESAVLRILDRSGGTLDFAALGMSEDTGARFLDALARPHSIVLVTGPTGSGKTTTLYASLKRLNTDETKILTVEDPVEYQLDGITQIQVKPQIGLDFAAVLRSMLRQDPDVMMIGEIRDGETAQIAVQAALTGHLVLSTLHTNGAAATVTRLMDMGVEPYLITATLGAVCAQRLVRVLCPACRRAEEAAPEVVASFRLDGFAGNGPIILHRAVGCEACRGSGYRGRTTIAEVLLMSDPIRHLVLAKAEPGEVHRRAVAEGMRPMLADGLRKAVEGVTTLEEVLRATRDG
jgi:general secretion pathway protein E